MCSFQTAFAEDNTGTGDINGDSAALANSNVFQLFSTGALALVKTAWLTSDGSPITSGSSVPLGTNVDFMIYVNNQSSVAINDVSIQDVLDGLFVYQLQSIRVDNSVDDCGATCDATEQAAIYAAASAVGNNLDAVDGDTSSFAGVTVDVGNEAVANARLDAVANKVLAVVFTVQVQ
jgi:uncharacterized repeat protein (TIGR01451 family)